MDSLFAGSMAGICVDLILYPIDTLKTRIQSKKGFLASGGLSNIYKGLSAVAIGSVPGGGAFFTVYDTTKRQLFGLHREYVSSSESSGFSAGVYACQAVAAMCGESSACCVRTPVEMIKQRMQVGHHKSIIAALRSITNNINITDTFSQDRVASGHIPVRIKGLHYLFSGMPIMLMRELPFSVIQMSLYEYLKYQLAQKKISDLYQIVGLPLCGAFSGGCAAFLTTPLDVIKTRIMLQPTQIRGKGRIEHVIRDLATEPARPGDRFGIIQRFFRGASARVLWISMGGSIFFGTYELFMRFSLVRAY
ncbi:unnamed protein product [Phytomonas sp. Hart1]|nr:unnamed protein product [Phytomonas sp. Hart1]|eukprot:CCW70513.1 unnamed protein product [Phytomonas sp. isolate Hart1]